MKAILNQPYKALSGKNGELVNFLYQGNPTVRQFVTPDNPNTPIQDTIRSYFTAASQAFSLLSDNERAAWKAISLNANIKNSLGQTYQISDKGMYVMVNAYRQFNEEAITDTAPTWEAAGAPTAVTGSGISDQLVVSIDAPASAGFFIVEATATLPGLQRKARDTDYRLIGTTPKISMRDRTGATTNFAIDAEAVKFSHSIGDRVGIKVTSLSSGYIRGSAFETEIAWPNTSP